MDKTFEDIESWIVSLQARYRNYLNSETQEEVNITSKKVKEAKEEIKKCFESYFQKRLKEVIPERIDCEVKDKRKRQPDDSEIAFFNGYNNCIELIKINAGIK